MTDRPDSERSEVRDSFAELAAVAAGMDAGTDLEARPGTGPGTRPGTGPGTALTRQGDHAVEVGDAAEPTLAPLLLHSLSDLREIWVPLLEASGARSIAEIGSESGVTTSLLVDLLRRGGGGRLVVIDPEPGVSPASGGGLDVHVIRGHSPQALDGHAPTDAYLIDGDHNYATVHGELTEIDRAVTLFGRSYFPLVILHDVGWPAGRRDQYYNPDRIPEDARQPHSWDVGVEIDNRETVPGGFRGMGAFAWALTEGGPRNGVRTAVEDFVADHPDLRFFTVAPIFGLGVVIDRRAPWARRVADLLTPWVSNRLLSRLERNRIDLYLHVLRLQDTAAAVARARQREWARLDDERSRLAAIELEHLHRIAQLEQEVAELRRHEQEREERWAQSHWAAADVDEPKLMQVARIANSVLRSRLSTTGQDRLARVQTRIAESGVAGRGALPALRRRSAAPAPPPPAASPGTRRPPWDRTSDRTSGGQQTGW
ncbi:class I SAM-dependent methyltransferase [Frankia sp. CcWB2]